MFVCSEFVSGEIYMHKDKEKRKVYPKFRLEM